MIWLIPLSTSFYRLYHAMPYYGKMAKHHKKSPAKAGGKEVKSMSKEKVLEALGEWIVHVCEAKEMATPAEIAALPEIAKAFLDATVFLP